MRKKILLYLCLLVLTSPMLLAQLQIKGTITDEEAQPLIGSSVVVKSSGQGTVTNSDGEFSIEVADTNEVLVFSFVGYLNEEIKVGNLREISITLLPNITDLDEVVVIGYGTVKRKDLTAPVASVGAKDLKDIPLTSTAQIMTGRLAGVQVTTSEGSPDADVRIRVRGGGSITQDNAPLYIVDGFPVDAINDIAPTDIETIDVLKDASSTAIYGSRGANGVVIITTKSGKQGKMKVNYNAYTGTKYLARKLDVLDPYEFTLYQYERSRGSFPERNRFEDLYGPWESLDSLYTNAKPTDWQEEVFGVNAKTTSHNLSLTGGTEKSSYNLSYTYNNDEGIMIGSGYIRNNLSFKFKTEATRRISLDFDARYSDLDVLGSGTSDPGQSSQNKLRHSVMYRPIDGLSEFTDDPDYEFSDDDYYSTSGLTDPVQLSKDEYRNRNSATHNYNGAINIDIIKDLRFRSEIGYYLKEDKDSRFYGPTSYLARRYGDMPVVRLEKNNQSRVRAANTLNFSRKFSGVHDLSMILGQEVLVTKRNEYSQEIQEFPEAISPEFALGSLSLGNAPQRPLSNISEDKMLSFFGRVNYSFLDKYLAQVSLRADGSSKFSEGNRWGYFPSVSAAWRLSEESFMDNIGFISSMKLRVSYGHAGNNRISDLYFLSRFETSPGKPYHILEQPQAYLYRSYPFNPDLKWEITVTRDIGIDWGIFNDRLHTSFDFYYNTTRDLLVEVPLDPSVGYESQMQNIGATTNKGFEAVLDAYIIDRKDFKLYFNFNIAANRNRVDKLADNMDEMLISSDWNDNTGADYIIREGDPVGLMYGFITDGYYTTDDFEIDPETGEFLLVDENYVLKPGIANNQGIIFDGFGPGSYRLRDLSDPVDSLGNGYSDGNLVTFEDDRTVIGNANPKHIGGMSISASYKAFDMSVSLNWVYGNDIYNANKIEFTSGYNAYTNLLQDMNSDVRWRTVNDEGEVVTNPEELAALNADATMWKPQTGRYLFHSWAVEDGSFLRINNLTLGYTFPKKWMKKIHIQDLRVYGTANNLYTFTRYSGYDPEVDTRRGSENNPNSMTPGVDYSAYPRSKIYMIGINLTL